MATLGLSAPWDTYVAEVEQMFMYDEEVHVVFDREEMELMLYVDAPYKAVALDVLLPDSKDFGDTHLKITIIPANANVHNVSLSKNDLFENAFSLNPAFSFVKTIHGVFPNDLTYVVFENRVVQYFNDNLGDIYGCCSTLYQNIAKDIFVPMDGVFFCTDKPSDLKGRNWSEQWP